MFKLSLLIFLENKSKMVKVEIMEGVKYIDREDSYIYGKTSQKRLWR